MRGHRAGHHESMEETLAGLALGAAQSGSGFYHVLWAFPIGSASLFALPSDNDLTPISGPPWATRGYFIVPRATRLVDVHLQGDAVRYASVNTVTGAFGPIPVNVDLYLDSAFVATLVTIPPSETTFDLFATPNIPIPAGSRVQFIIDLTGWASGQIGNFLANFAIGP
jgi:hypothetical protein